MRYEAPQITERLELTGLLNNLGKSPGSEPNGIPYPQYPQFLRP